LPDPTDPHDTGPPQVPPSPLSGLLVRLDEHLERAGAPLARAWKPGITLGEFRVFAPDIGQPPAEIAEWFAWHDGAHFVGVDPTLPNNLEPFDLYAAMKERELCLESWGHQTGFDSHGTYFPQWLPICGRDDSVIVADCSGGPSALAPIHYVDNHSSTDYDAVLAESLTEMVGLWVDLLERGKYRYDSENAYWHLEGRFGSGVPLPPYISLVSP
jgi:hypothetical protein